MPTDDLPPSDASLTQLRERADVVLDVTGLDCPLPVLKARSRLRDMPPGRTLLVLATDPHSTVDFEAFCARTRISLLAQGQDGTLFFFLLRQAEKHEKT